MKANRRKASSPFFEIANVLVHLMQRGPSFNLDAVKAEMAKKMAQAEAASKGTGQ